MAFKIMPITDANAITFHYLQCINNKVKMEADSKKVLNLNKDACLQQLCIRL